MCSFDVIVLLHLVIFYFVIFGGYILEMDLERREGEETERSRGRGNYNQDIL